MAIQLKPQSVGGLEIAANGADSGVYAKKADPFIKKEIVYGPNYLVTIPQEAKVFRPKGGELLFFRYQPSPNNHVVEIPEGAKHIQYPQYHAHDKHINYGEPVFHY